VPAGWPVACHDYGRYGYRRITAPLQEAGWQVGKDRVQRIWRREGLKVPQKQRPRGRLCFNDGSCVRLRPERPNHVWSYDFVSARTHDGRTIRMLTLIDEFFMVSSCFPWTWCIQLLTRQPVTKPVIENCKSRGRRNSIVQFEFAAHLALGVIEMVRGRAIVLLPGSSRKSIRLLTAWPNTISPCFGVG